MQNVGLLWSLGGGVGASLLLFFVLYRGVRLGSRLASLLTALAALGIYIPLALLFWPGIDVFAIHFAFLAMTAYGLGIITSRDPERQLAHSAGTEAGQAAAAPRRRLHWAPATIVGFFLVLAVVDSIIITLASQGASSDFMARFLPEPRSGRVPSSAFPGAVPHNFHEKYAQFNQHLLQLEAQRERGWQVRGSWEREPLAGQEAVLQLQVADADGQVIRDAEVAARFLRPSDQRQDQSMALAEQQPGLYQGRVTLDAPGNWTVVITVMRGQETHEIKAGTRIGIGG
ncbi:MAG: FixH family protein [Thiothrix sp.]|nr:FixH family protein [Thiothrix sp.]HPE60673.1 FixH family protein [Thiolinea sp.]